MALRDKKREEMLRAIGQQPSNRNCFECGGRPVTYVNLFNKTFVCTTCCGALIHIGHRIKSISAARFTDEEVLGFEDGGNDAAKKIWLAYYEDAYDMKPTPDKIKDFVREKYEKKRWYRAASVARNPRNDGESRGDVSESGEYSDFEVSSRRAERRLEKEQRSSLSHNNLNDSIRERSRFSHNKASDDDKSCSPESEETRYGTRNEKGGERDRNGKKYEESLVTETISINLLRMSIRDDENRADNDDKPRLSSKGNYRRRPFSGTKQVPVECPICFAQVDVTDIESHMGECKGDDRNDLPRRISKHDSLVLQRSSTDQPPRRNSTTSAKPTQRHSSKPDTAASWPTHAILQQETRSTSAVDELSSVFTPAPAPAPMLQMYYAAGGMVAAAPGMGYPNGWPQAAMVANPYAQTTPPQSYQQPQQWTQAPPTQQPQQPALVPTTATTKCPPSFSSEPLVPLAPGQSLPQPDRYAPLVKVAEEASVFEHPYGKPTLPINSQNSMGGSMQQNNVTSGVAQNFDLQQQQAAQPMPQQMYTQHQQSMPPQQTLTPWAGMTQAGIVNPTQAALQGQQYMPVPPGMPSMPLTGPQPNIMTAPPMAQPMYMAYPGVYVATAAVPSAAAMAQLAQNTAGATTGVNPPPTGLDAVNPFNLGASKPMHKEMQVASVHQKQQHVGAMGANQMAHFMPRANQLGANHAWPVGSALHGQAQAQAQAQPIRYF